MANEIHKGDIGTIFRITLMDGEVIMDVSSATSMSIKFSKPKATPTAVAEVVVKTAVFETDGTDGVIQYATILGDLDTLGKWGIQGYVELPAWQGHSDKGTFKVFDNYEQV